MNMLNSDAKLVADPFAKDVDKKSTRDGFGTGVVEAGKVNPHVVVLSADLKESTRAEWFEKEFPDRFIEMGVAEQNMVTVAAGLAAVGKIPFVTSYAAFSPGRNYEQIRTTIALNRVPVKVCGMHAGVSVGPDGATHQMLEDIGMMRMLPEVVVINPMDAEEARKATIAAALHDGAVYLRFGRADVPIITTSETPFVIGKALTLWEGDTPKIAFLGNGGVTYNALLAARALAAENISSLVISIPTVKPLDEEAIITAVQKTGKVITIEEHQVAGGFGSAVVELLSKKYPVPVERIGLQDEFGQSGTPDELIEHYGLGAAHIVEVARRMLQK